MIIISIKTPIAHFVSCAKVHKGEKSKGQTSTKIFIGEEKNPIGASLAISHFLNKDFTACRGCHAFI